MAKGRAVTIWHNPRCGKLRERLALLRDKGVEPRMLVHNGKAALGRPLEAVLAIVRT